MFIRGGHRHSVWPRNKDPLFEFANLGMGKYYDRFLWSALILTALREPLEQFPSGQMAYLLYAFLTGLFMNALQAYYFKKAGFLASLSMRLGHYLFWHILLGVYVQYVELAQ